MLFLLSIHISKNDYQFSVSDMGGKVILKALYALKMFLIETNGVMKKEKKPLS